MPDDHYIYEQIKKAQLQDGVFVPYGYSGARKNKPKVWTPVGRFVEMLEKEFDAVTQYDYHKWSKVYVTVEPMRGLELEDYMVLLRLLVVYPDDRRQGLSALALRCLRECSDATGAAIGAFSNPVELISQYATRADLMTAYKAGSMQVDYTYNKSSQKRMGYRFMEAGYKRIDWDSKTMVEFCDEQSSYVYLPDSFNPEIMDEVIRPRLVESFSKD